MHIPKVVQTQTKIVEIGLYDLHLTTSIQKLKNEEFLTIIITKLLPIGSGHLLADVPVFVTNSRLGDNRYIVQLSKWLISVNLRLTSDQVVSLGKKILSITDQLS
jgi:hypothetical protein